jgi:hypothetical protein
LPGPVTAGQGVLRNFRTRFFVLCRDSAIAGGGKSVNVPYLSTTGFYNGDIRLSLPVCVVVFDSKLLTS